MNLSIALGHVHTKQWKAIPTADAGLVPVLSFMSGKSLCSVSYLLQSVNIEQKTRSHVLYCRKGLQRQGFEEEILKNAYFCHPV